MRNLIHVVVIAAMSLLAVTSEASTFTLTPNTPGLTFTVENQGLAATDLYAGDGLTDTYKILLTLTTTSSYVNVGADADLLAAFSMDLSTSPLQGVSLVTSPAGFSWTLFAENKVPGNSAKCSGSEAGAFCVEETPSVAGNLVLDANATYSWLFNVDLGANGFGSLTLLDVGIGSLKSNGPNYSFQGTLNVVGQTGSLAPGGGTLPPDAAPVPEPGSLLLLGSGLVFAASRFRRVKK